MKTKWNHVDPHEAKRKSLFHWLISLVKRVLAALRFGFGSLPKVVSAEGDHPIRTFVEVDLMGNVSSRLSSRGVAVMLNAVGVRTPRALFHSGDK
jgi:hypothetical protein